MTSKVSRGLVAALVLLGCACGGGEGDPPAPPGAFTLSANSLAFHAEFDNSPSPQDQHITMTLQGAEAPFVAYGFADGVDPAWLVVNILAYDGEAATFQLFVASSDLEVGTYETTLILATLDANQEILDYENVHVVLVVEQSLAFSSAPLQHTLTFGSSETTKALTVPVSARGKNWSVTGSESWIHVPAGVMAGSSALPMTLDATGLAPGAHQGSITITNVDDASEHVSLQVSLNMTMPDFILPPGLLTFGGWDGYGADESQQTSFALSTGSREHPWTLELVELDPSGWLSADELSGSVDSSGETIGLTVNRSGLGPGTHYANLLLSADVDGYVIEETIWVYLNVGTMRLVPDHQGVALLDLPARQLLQRSIVVRDSAGFGDIPWTAESDQAWLSITASGVSDEPLLIVADPSALVSDSAHVAHVTLHSSDSRVDRPEVIRVVLWKGNSAPADLSVASTATRLAVNPADPLVYVNSGGTSISSYNVYTGALVGTIVNAGQKLGQMAVSGDGTRLFVVDANDGTVGIFDAATGALVGRRVSHSPELVDATTPVIWRRVQGRDLLFSDTTFDLESDASFWTPLVDNDATAISSDGRRALRIANGGYVGDIRVTYSPLYTGYLQTIDYPGAFIGGLGLDLTVASSGAVFGASNEGSVDVLSGNLLEEHTSIAVTGQPNNVETAWNDSLCVGATDSGSSRIELYSDAGVLAGTIGTGMGTLVPASLRLSGDGTRAVALQDSPGGRLLLMVTLPPD